MSRGIQIGDTLEGKYEIKSQIGEGGMGVVYAGQHKDLEMRVAIKVLHPIEADDPSMIDRFKIEARSSASIKHPNVVEVYDFGLSPDGRPFFVMEHLDGESLADLLDRRRILKQSQCVEITDQILSGLARAHKRDIIHRDLKPENIFLAKTEEGRRVVKILDFGIAKIAREGGGTMAINALEAEGRSEIRATRRFKTEHGVVMGTPGYMAPETLTGQTAVDTRADLFAVGVLVFEMLTGRQPFRGTSPHEIMLNTANNPVPELSAINKAITKEMEQLCLIALAKNPIDRFQNAEEFIAYLTAAAVGRIPEHGRKCKTNVGMPSLIPPAPEDHDSISLDSSSLDTDSLRRHAPRPVDVASQGGFSANAAGWDQGPASRQPKRKQWQPPGQIGGTYRGPARSKRLMFSFSFFKIFMFLGIVGAAGYMVKTSALFGVPQEVPDNTGYDIFESEADKRVNDGYEQRLPPKVTIWVDVTPADADVLWDGELMEDRPFRVTSGKSPVKVEVVSPGYKRKLLVVTPDDEKTIRANLQKE